MCIWGIAKLVVDIGKSYGDVGQGTYSGPLLSKYSHPQNPFGSRILRVCCDVSMT